MPEYQLLSPGYVMRGDELRVGSSVSLIKTDGALIIVDPGMVSARRVITDALLDAGHEPEEVTDIIISHHHPDHTINAALFPRAEVVDAWAHSRGDRWDDHDGDGHRLSPHVWLIMTPGHTAEDLTLLAETDDGVVACTHAWWRTDRTPEVDPGANDQAVLDASRQRILEEADLVVPGHGEPFATGRTR